MFLCMRFIVIILLCLHGIARGAEDRIVTRDAAIKQTLNAHAKFPAALTTLVWEYAAPMKKLHPVAHVRFPFKGGEDCHDRVYIIRSAPDDGITIRCITVRHKGKLLIRGSYCDGDKPYEEDDDAYELIAKRCNKSPDEITLEINDFPMVDDNRARLNDAFSMLGSILWYKVSLRKALITDPIYKSAQEKSLLFFEQDVTFDRFVRGLRRAHALAVAIDEGWFTYQYEQIAENCEKLASEIVPGEDILFEDSEKRFNPYLTW